MIELKQCPFCGGKPEYKGCDAFNGCIAIISCKCGAKVECGNRLIGMALHNDSKYEEYGTDYIANRQAIDAWNNRA